MYKCLMCLLWFKEHSLYRYTILLVFFHISTSAGPLWSTCKQLHGSLS